MATFRLPRAQVAFIALALSMLGGFTMGYFAAWERMPLERQLQPHCTAWVNS